MRDKCLRKIHNEYNYTQVLTLDFYLFYFFYGAISFYLFIYLCYFLFLVFLSFFFFYVRSLWKKTEFFLFIHPIYLRIDFRPSETPNAEPRLNLWIKVIRLIAFAIGPIASCNTAVGFSAC